MKRLLFFALIFYVCVCAAQAQQVVSINAQETPLVANTAASFGSTSAASVPLIKPLSPTDSLFASDTRFFDAGDLASTASGTPATVTTALALPLSAANPGAPEPSPNPTPRFIYSDRDDYRWQLFVGVSFERFRSSIYSASAAGTDTSITYFLNDWLGVEGNVATYFAPTILAGYHVKLVNYGGGARVTWRRPRWEPWFHGIVGGTHALPQTADESQNGFQFQLGGGADYRLAPRLSVRGEVDYVRTHLFGQWQNNGQADLGIVLHF